MGFDDDRGGLMKIMNLLKVISVMILAMHFYCHCYRLFVDFGLTSDILDRFILRFDSNIRIFSNGTVTKSVSLLFIILSVFGARGSISESIRWGSTIVIFTVGLLLYYLICNIPDRSVTAYLTICLTGYTMLFLSISWAGRLIRRTLVYDDLFNVENESFPQEQRFISNEYSVNLSSRFYFRGRMQNGWINIINPFRGTIVLGTPGSGKTYAVINSFIRQQIEKGFAMYIYDYKYPDLALTAYRHLLDNYDKYSVRPEFYVINFDDPRRSHRCNPIDHSHMTDISDAYESAYTIMLNLNKTWVLRQGDFFVESPIILLAAIIWFLKIYENGRFCTFPHAIEILNKEPEKVFPILMSYPEIENYISPFRDAMEHKATDQLQGQIASAKIPLSRLISPQLYWVMSGNDFSLDINNPDHPKILVVCNNPERQNIYGAALGLYNSRIVKLINKKNRLHSSVIIDELPTIYFKGLDNLIATARSNKVAVCLGFQDFSQLVRDYGEKEASVVINTVGNIISGQVLGKTAKDLSQRFGRIRQKTQSMSNGGGGGGDYTFTEGSNMDNLLPESKISTLSQGVFVGAVADNINEKIPQKIFHAEIIVDSSSAPSNREDIPIVTPFLDENGYDRMDEIIQQNYRKIKEDAVMIIENECRRIRLVSKRKKF